MCHPDVPSRSQQQRPVGLVRGWLESWKGLFGSQKPSFPSHCLHIWTLGLGKTWTSLSFTSCIKTEPHDLPQKAGKRTKRDAPNTPGPQHVPHHVINAQEALDMPADRRRPRSHVLKSHSQQGQFLECSSLSLFLFFWDLKPCLNDFVIYKQCYWCLAIDSLFPVISRVD